MTWHYLLQAALAVACILGIRALVVSIDNGPAMVVTDAWGDV